MKPVPNLTGEIKVDLYFSGNFSESQKEALMEEIGTYLVDKSLHVDVEQTVELHFNED